MGRKRFSRANYNVCVFKTNVAINQSVTTLQLKKSTLTSSISNEFTNFQLGIIHLQAPGESKKELNK